DCFVKSATGWPAFCANCASLSRSGPTVPVVPAALNVWHAPQPCAVKTAFPAPALPVTAVGFAIFPTTFVGVGVTIFSPQVLESEQPAARRASAAIRASRRKAASLNRTAALTGG